MKPTFVVLTKLPGRLPVKTRLWDALGREGAERVYAWMLQRTVARLARVAPPVVAFSPPDADPLEALPPLADCRFLPTPGENGAACLEHALAASFTGRPLIAFGGDAPDLPLSRIAALGRSVARHDAALVPSLDGGFTALAVARPIEGLARAFAFGGHDAACSLVGWLGARELSCEVLPAWPDVDTPADLEALHRRDARACAPADVYAPSTAGPRRRIV